MTCSSSKNIGNSSSKRLKKKKIKKPQLQLFEDVKNRYM